MTETGTTAAVRLSIEVEVDLDRAFEVFTGQFDLIKPREHNLLAAPVAETVLEPKAGGRLYDRAVDGSTCDWGRVLACEPPHRLLLAWHISPHWQLETEPGRASEVEVRFTALDAGRTRVDLEHRHLDRHGEAWQAMRGALESGEGWPLYLARYARLLAEH
ncbi:MAG: SRPBCC family protein [Sporichthyaceae bacterium]